MRIVIVGGGLGGLATALSLHAAGFTSVVYESAREIRTVGVGINLPPHAVRELTELGLGETLAEIALPPDRLIYHDRSGNRVWDEPLGLAAGYDWPHYSVHRGELQMLLLEAVRQRIGGNAVWTGMEFGHFSPDADGVTAHFSDRATGAPIAKHADLLIGADGIDSRVRSQLYPDTGPACWNGMHLWRGLSSYPHVLGGRSIIVAGGSPGTQLVVYPIADPKVEGGDAVMNWVLKISRDDSSDRDRSPRRISANEVREYVHDLRLPFIDLAALVGLTAEIFQYPMLDRDPLPQWSFEAVTLLGDAAHPMYPVGMNGASQAIIDARVLAWCLAHEGEPCRALRRYDEIRRAVVNRLVEANRENGPQKIIAMAEANNAIPRATADRISQNYKRLAGLQAQTLNARDSWSPRPQAERGQLPNREADGSWTAM